MFIFLIVIFPCLLHAQVNSFIAFGSSHGIELKYKSIPGFHIGGYLEFPTFWKLKLQTGLEVNQFSMDRDMLIVEYLGGQQHLYRDGSVSEYNFIELPIILAKDFLIKDNSYFIIQTGCYVSLFTGGKATLRTDTGYADYLLVPTESDLIGGGLLLGTGFKVGRTYIGLEGNLNLPDGRKPITIFKTKFTVNL